MQSQDRGVADRENEDLAAATTPFGNASSGWTFSDSVGKNTLDAALTPSTRPGGGTSQHNVADLVIALDQMHRRVRTVECQRDLEVAQLQATIAQVALRRVRCRSVLLFREATECMECMHVRVCLHGLCGWTGSAFLAVVAASAAGATAATSHGAGPASARAVKRPRCL